MARWLDYFRNRKRTPQRTRTEPRLNVFPTVSRAEDITHFNDSGFIPLPNDTPFEMLRVYRFLRDAIPDLSDAVWTWKRLCQTGYDVEPVEPTTDLAQHEIERHIANLNARVNSGDRGMEGLLDIFYTSLFTYGAAALEIVLNRDRSAIYNVVPVDVWTVRFRRERSTLQAYQIHDGHEIRLPARRFIYIGLDRDGTNPYGRSMLRSIPFVVKIQQRLLEDMAKAMHNLGWAKLHVRYTPEPRERGESAEAYRDRVQHSFQQLRDRLSKLEVDQNLITYDNIAVELIRGDQRSLVFYENHKAIEEQIITGTHLMPILLGRNYGTTETYGTAQFEIINRQVDAVNRSVQDVLERIYNFELSLVSGNARVRVRMRHNRTVDPLKEAQARAHEIENALRLRDNGFLPHGAAAKLLGINEAAAS